MNKIIFSPNYYRKVPRNSIFAKFFINLNNLGFIRNLNFVRLGLLRSFNFPKSTSIGKDFYCSSQEIQIGINCSLSDTYIVAYSKVKIGDNCSFSFRNFIVTSSHEINDFSNIVSKDIVIGDNCWITTNVTILGGVTIGNNCIIGAGSVVTNDIPANVFAAGNPCKVIKKIKFNK